MYKVGEENESGYIIEQIYTRNNEFSVYRTKHSIACTVINPSNDLRKRISILEYYKARTLALINHDTSKYLSISSLIASAVSINIEGDTDSAIKILEFAEKRIFIIKTIVGRIFYTLSAFSVVLLLFIVCLISHKHIHNQIIKDAINSAFFGSIGAAMSIALGYQSIEIDVDSTDIVNSLMGFSRILIGIFASIFCLLSIKNDIAFSFVKNHIPWGIWMISMMSGFVEKLAPNIIGKLSEKTS